MVLYVSMQLFEGMKAFRGTDDKARLFRPLENMKRLNRSAVAMSLPVSDHILKVIYSIVDVHEMHISCCVYYKLSAYCCVACILYVDIVGDCSVCLM